MSTKKNLISITIGIVILVPIIFSGCSFYTPPTGYERATCGKHKYAVGGDNDYILLNPNLSAKNPTYLELTNFLIRDKTNQIIYNSTWVCSDYAELLYNNAQRQGIKCGYVGINFKDMEIGHACNVFDTVDKGLVYIDDTGDLYGLGPDCIANFSVNSKYCLRNFYNGQSSWCLDSQYIVESIYITW